MLERTSPPTRTRVLAVAVALLVAVVGLACSSSSSDAGAGFRLSASQLESTPKLAPQPTPPGQVSPVTTTVATAQVRELEILAERPGAPGSGSDVQRGSLPPIPRPDLNSAGARKTDQGWAFANPTYWGKPLVVPVVAQDGEWIKVHVPARPNGQEGWVRAGDVTLSTHDFHGELNLSDFTLRVWQGSEPLVETQVVIGTPRTPTPVGRLYITELLTAADAGVSPGGAYGPHVLSTNTYSEALDLFDNGLPVIAFHGTNSPGLIGTKASNGCIRLPNDVVTQLAQTLPAGVPIDVKA